MEIPQHVAVAMANGMLWRSHTAGEHIDHKVYQFARIDIRGTSKRMDCTDSERTPSKFTYVNFRTQ
jgi:hypothetical protein